MPLSQFIGPFAAAMRRHSSRTAMYQLVACAFAMVVLAGCASAGRLPTASAGELSDVSSAPLYRIGPGDTLSIFVWENPQLSVTVPVRPDGRISTPLVEDLQAAGRTPTELARTLETRLATYVKNPVVNVIVTNFVGRDSQQIRVVGQATSPKALPYRAGMTLLDVMIAVGGLTDYAAGNRAVLIRTVDGRQKQFHVRLDDLMRDGDISGNVKMLPGDILMIPEAWF